MVMGATIAARRRRHRRWALAVALVLGVLLGVLWWLGELGHPPETTAQRLGRDRLVQFFAEGCAMPYGLGRYWRERAPNLDPIDDADVIVAGTVERVRRGRRIWVKNYCGTNVWQSGWLTHADLAVECAVKGIGPGRKHLSVGYFTPEHGYLGGLGDAPHALGPGVSYLLFLKRGGPFHSLQFSSDRDADPPPFPLASIDPNARNAGTPAEIVTALAIASRNGPDSDLTWYATPVLGYLGEVRHVPQAHAALMGLATSEDPKDVKAALYWLTDWGMVPADVLALAETRAYDPDPAIGAEALAVRIEADRTTALVGDVIAWANRPGASEQDCAPLVLAMDHMYPPETVTKELLSQYDQLLGPGVPTPLRIAALSRLSKAGAADELVRQCKKLLGADAPKALRLAVVRQLTELDTEEVVPLLIEAVDDPDLEVGYQATVGLGSAVGADHPELRVGCVSSDEFKADHELVVGFWKRWWETASRDGWPPRRKPQPGQMGPPGQQIPPGFY